jgi:acetyl esterase/lipase
MDTQIGFFKVKKILPAALLFFCMEAVMELDARAGGSYLHIQVNDSVSAIIDHPAFKGFSRYLMPWDNREYNGEMPLSNIGQLMPYHRHVEPRVVVDAINRMIDDINAGNTIFYDFYTEQQKRTDLSKRTTGLFFFRGRPGSPFAVVCPGGGFSYVGSLHEGFPLAAAISSPSDGRRNGYNAFVIKYRVGSERLATEDLAAALSFIIANAKTLEVSVNDYSVWGSSAGARIAANIGTYGVAYYGGDAMPKPAIVVIAYTGHSDYSNGDPPTFTIVGERDGIAPPALMERRVNAMRDTGVEVEFQIYENIGHGFGLGTGTTAEGWQYDAIRFWKKYIGRTK